MHQSLLQILAYQFWRFFNPQESYYVGYVAGAFVLASAVYLWRWRRRGRVPVRAVLKLWASRRVLLHASSRLDYKLYLMNGVLMVTAYVALQFSSSAWRSGALNLLRRLGPDGALVAPKFAAMAVTTVAIVLVIELGYWAMHYAFHRVPLLWRFHAVHHSAEVMTPFTEYRQHPLEFLAFGNMVSLAVGITTALAAWVFGPTGQPFTLMQVNVILLVHFMTIHHLRHTSIWIGARGWLGRLIHTPAHHQIHHSNDPRHFDRNFGYALSVWDWAFGTLYVPERRERLKLGLEGQQAQYTGVIDTLVRPFKPASAAGDRRSRDLAATTLQAAAAPGG